MEYDKIMEMAVTELTELGVRRLREEDAELDGLVRRRVELSSKVNRAIESMGESDRRLLEEYCEALEDIDSRQMEYLYLQGGKDCVRLLKKLGAI